MSSIMTSNIAGCVFRSWGLHLSFALVLYPPPREGGLSITGR